MLYRLRTKLVKRLFNARISAILTTPPINFVPADLTILSMVSHDDLLMYLLAIKSLYERLGYGKITIINDGTLTPGDQIILRRHLQSPNIVERKTIPIGRYVRHMMWERLAYEVDLSAKEYVIQLDSDTITRGPIHEVLNCVARNRAFTLGTWDGQKIVSVAEASVYSTSLPSQNHMQIVSEKALSDLSNAEEIKYVRGSAGFVGLARGGFSRERAEIFCVQMIKLVGERFKEWGGDQIASNYIVANSPDAYVLPYPDYAVVGPELKVDQARFLHFIGSYRFNGGIYARLGRRLINPAVKAAP
jgi:hypothetical protein